MKVLHNYVNLSIILTPCGTTSYYFHTCPGSAGTLWWL